MQLVLTILAIIAVLSAVMVITRKNPVHSALWLVFTFMCLAGIYVVLGAEFLAAVQIFVYAGGIMLLYIFVIMLVLLREPPPQERYFHKQWIIALVVGVGLLFMLYTYFGSEEAKFEGMKDIYTQEKVEAFGGNTMALARELFSTYLFPFEVASLILLVAMLGAVILGRTPRELTQKAAEEPETEGGLEV